jgi:methylmalonyl-CoA decarboxylase
MDMALLETKLVQARLDGKIGTIAFDHYEKRNALGSELIAEIGSTLNEFRAEGVRVVVLRTANGGNVWSAGHEVSELPKADVDPLPYTDPFEQLLRAVKKFPAPVIAMIHGTVWGGACDLVMNCDLVFGDETRAFAITPAKLGLPYNAGGFLTFMTRLPLAIVKEMFFTSEPITAERAERVGIVNAIVPAAQLEERVYATAKIITTRSAAAIAAFKEAMRVLSEAVAINPATYEYLQSLRRDVYFGADYREGIQAFLEKRPAKF